MVNKSLVVEKLLVFLPKAYHEIRNGLSNLSFDKGKRQDYHLVCLYATILEISQDCLLLCESYSSRRFIVGLPILLRSNIEAYVDFLNLIKYKSYVDTMKASWLEEHIKLLQGTLSNQDSPYTKNLSNYGDTEKQLEIDKKELESLKLINKKPKNIAERFKLAELTNEYNSIYRILCSYSHNSPSALERRHVERSEEDYRIVLFKEDPEILLPYISTLCGILTHSSQCIHEFFKSSMEKDMEKLCEEFKVICQL